MIYVETNFLICLGIQQEQSDAAKNILELATSGSIDLAIPDLAVVEAIHTVTGWRHRHDRLRDDLNKELAELRRVPSTSDLSSSIHKIEEAVGVLTGLDTRQLKDLLDAIQLVVASSRIIPLSSAIFQSAAVFQQQGGISPLDSILVASIAADLESLPGRPSLFLSTDEKLINRIRFAFKNLDCRCISSFEDGLRFIEKPQT